MQKQKIFYKTEHFLLRQWERNISDSCVSIISLNAKPSCKMQKVVAFPMFLKRLCGISTKLCLVIMIKGSSLITCYWQSLEETFFAKDSLNDCELQSLM